VLLIGTNNARHSTCTPEEIAAGVRAIIERIAAKSPSTKVLLQAIFPRGAGPDDPWRQRCAQINALLPALADGKRVHFIDINTRLINPDGSLSKTVMPDLLHPNAEGYEIWANAIEAKLNELLQ